ncbi:hypothetical protein M0802_000309 [Mischocyttarus mexicanus]|nr:hypothetical protein M0802_000309 [Mischocyttarus mexicanus]
MSGIKIIIAPLENLAKTMLEIGYENRIKQKPGKFVILRFNNITIEGGIYRCHDKITITIDRYVYVACECAYNKSDYSICWLAICLDGEEDGGRGEEEEEEEKVQGRRGVQTVEHIARDEETTAE